MSFDKKLFHEIEEELGVITDFKIEHNEGMSIIKYKSNGVDKEIYTTDNSMKQLLQCLMYCASYFSLKPIVGCSASFVNDFEASGRIYWKST